jgi:hypothetical protein
MKDAVELKNHVYDIVGALHSVHDELGPGINEYCYQEALAMELSDRGIPSEREKAFHPRYKGRPMDAEYSNFSNFPLAERGEMAYNSRVQTSRRMLR